MTSMPILTIHVHLDALDDGTAAVRTGTPLCTRHTVTFKRASDAIRYAIQLRDAFFTADDRLFNSTNRTRTRPTRNRTCPHT